MATFWVAAVVSGARRRELKICYVDESGGCEPEGSSEYATPLMVIAGLIVDHADVRAMTADHLQLKKTFYPSKMGDDPRLLSFILGEVKGTDVRKELRSGNRDKRRHGVGYLDRVIDLFERYNARIVGRVWVKEPGEGLDPVASYTFAIQDIGTHFEHSLVQGNQAGILIVDSRSFHQNRGVSHSVFTMKQRQAGDRLPHIVEAPVFGSSDNHAGLQLADLLAGAFLLPMACQTYCAGAKTHNVTPRYDVLKERYGDRLRQLQHSYRTASGRATGGIVVSDPRGRRPSSALFH